MKDELVSFEVAELAKQKGFNLKCYWFCTYKRKSPTNNQSFFPQLGEYKNFNTKDKGFYELFSLPTQSLLKEWIEATFGIVIYLKPSYDHLNCELKGFFIKLNNKHGGEVKASYFSLDDKYKGLNIILKEALKLIK